MALEAGIAGNCTQARPSVDLPTFMRDSDVLPPAPVIPRRGNLVSCCNILAGKPGREKMARAVALP
jgi:hypothetical protein